jgi:hypothetical protein
MRSVLIASDRITGTSTRIVSTPTTYGYFASVFLVLTFNSDESTANV